MSGSQRPQTPWQLPFKPYATPVRNVSRPFTCQLPSAASTALGILRPQALPRPNGNSYVNALVKLWRISQDALAYPDAQSEGSGNPMFDDPLSGVPALASAWLHVYEARNC